MVRATDMTRLQQMRIRLRNDRTWLDEGDISFLYVPELDEASEALQEAEDAVARAIASLGDQ